MDIKKFAVALTTTLHLLDANDKPMFSTFPEGHEKAGENDESKPMRVNIFGPGSKQHAAASAKRNNRQVDLLKKKGKTDLTADEQTAERAQFLADCTDSWENVDYGDYTGKEMSKAIYSDHEIGFIAEQVGREMGDWGNFSKGSIKP